MPIYTFVCETCSHVTEELFSVNERPDEIRCKICGSTAKFEISGSHFKVKGANAANNYSGSDNYQWFKPKA